MAGEAVQERQQGKCRLGVAGPSNWTFRSVTRGHASGFFVDELIFGRAGRS